MKDKAYRRAHRERTRNLKHYSSKAHVDDFAVKDFHAATNDGGRAHRDAAGLAMLVFESALSRPEQLEDAVLVDWFVEEKAGAGVEGDGESAGTLVVAKENDWSQLRRIGFAYLLQDRQTVDLGRVQIEKDNIELAFGNETGDVGTIVKSEGFDSRRLQSPGKEVTDLGLVIENKRALHDSPALKQGI